MISLRASTSALLCAFALGGCGAAENTALPAPAARTGAVRSSTASFKIYVANIGDGTITTFEPNGTQTSPTISTGDYLYSVAVAPNGKIYAVTFNPLDGPSSNATVTSYRPDGTPTTPTITFAESGYKVPCGLAVDRNGKIYVLSSAHEGTAGIVTTYRSTGERTKPTFQTGIDSSAIAI